MTEDLPVILLVDDEPTNLRVLRTVLNDLYRLLFAKNGLEALQLAAEHQPDLVLLDVMMPGMTGFEVCTKLKADAQTRHIPVIFVTALRDEIDETQGFDVGAVDYITKPITPAVVRARVKTHLSLVQAEELKKTRLQIIQRLGRAAEYRDNETGLHILRMSHFSQVIALAYGLSPKRAEDLLHAAPMHDIGKIGIRDDILLKPGKLTDDEFKEMQRHPLIGAEILGDADSHLLKLAQQVALYHHEKWDGSGYPHGLQGEAIPLEARIVALCDVFDALTSTRPYKSAWSIEDTMAHLQAQKGRHFDPQLVDLLEQELPKILEIRARWAE
ncbi:HD domain-containing phosphohydrolase [Rheinheimera texasensis]|uniref:HD domain-containing phosphohydrolase n=1 Tax=Rheinheimera texasensis TaxID=306205 RepID=UPI0032B2290C